MTSAAGAALLGCWPGPASAADYRVRWGDTLSAIAARYGTSVQALAAANRLDPAGTLLAGTVLRVPAAASTGASAGGYRVRVGDTLSGIAARFGTTVQALAAANRLDAGGILFAGIMLRVPGSAAPAVVVTAARGSYVVRPGDSLGAIAARFGTSVSALAAANRLDPAKILFAGTTLSVPGGTAATSTVVSVSRSAMHDQVRSLVVYWAGRYGVSPSLALALAWMESGFQTTVVSRSGAFGPMQVTPATREFVEVVLLGMPVSHTTSGEVQVGTVYLAHLLRRFGGDERLALAGYFQGPEGVRKHLLPSTRQYVANVLALKSRF